MAASPSASNAKVLVADDSDAERASARAALTAAGYTVVEATDGQQALETCRILKAKTQSTYLPVIMVSTRNSVNARVEGLRSGADDYLGKPYDAEELRARVEALLRARRVLGEPELADTLEASVRQPEPGAPTAVIAADHTSFRRRMEEEFDRAERYSDPLACLRVELDDFSEMLRANAEAAGELVSSLHDIVTSSIRKIDLVFRSDEAGYLLALPNTHFPGALSVAERIWRDAKRMQAPHDGHCSVSIGVSFFPNRDMHSLKDLLQLVDAALERARNEGGGKICLYQHQGYLYAPED